MLANKAADILSRHVELTKEELLRLLEQPPKPELGDVAFPCFTLAKQFRKAPPLIAQELAGAIQEEGVRAEAAGPYVNFFFDHGRVAVEILDEVLGDSFGRLDYGQGQRVIIDMSSPNIAKPFGIGHLRSTMIGNALYHIYKAVGYEAVNVNHLGDWGTQFGKQIVAYKRWGDPEKIKENPIQECLQLYVRFHEEAEKEPALEDEARDWFRRLELGDEEANRLWKYFITESLKEFNRMYDKLGVRFDHFLGESFYNDKMEAVVDELKKRGLLEESDGAMVVRLEEQEMPPCIILKSDGSTLYPTRDLATALYRHEQMKGEKLLYVVGAEQSLHFQQVFTVLKKMDRDWADRCKHVAFGLMKFEGKKMSTRRGRVVFLEEVLQEAVARAKAIIEEKNPGLPDKDAVADAVGIGAIIFGDLKNSRLHEIDFSLEEALNFDGETGPYVQYTFARTQSLLEKAGESMDAFTSGAAGSTGAAAQAQGRPAVQGEYLEGAEAWELLKELVDYPNVLLRATDRNEPSALARYVLELARKFNRFYHHERIVVDNEGERTAKLALTAAAGKVLRDGLQLLGLKTPNRI